MRALLIVIEGAAQPLFQRKPWASHGRVQRRSEGRDITAFHWEMAGVEVKAPFPVFERFPEKLVRAIEAQAGVEFIMKWARDSASDFDALVKRHIQTGRLILGATAGSGMHIMAHEQVMPLARLYATCRVARRQCDAYRLATVIARPLAGPAGGFAFAAGMHVYAMLPPRTVLNAIADAGITVEAVGSVADIFAGSGVTRRHRADSPEEGMEIIDRLWSAMHGGLLFANLSVHPGGRRPLHDDHKVSARLHSWLDAFPNKLDADDLLIVVADPTGEAPGADFAAADGDIPLLAAHGGEPGDLGAGITLSDVAATVAAFFDLKQGWPAGKPFFSFRWKKGHPFHHPKKREKPDK